MLKLKMLLVVSTMVLATVSSSKANIVAETLENLFSVSDPRLPLQKGKHHHRFVHTVWRARAAHSVFMLASYYGSGEKLNAYTASGERFRAGGLTAAHRSLPMGTRLLVSHAGRSVVVRINDRGPAAHTGRSLDLARGAAQRLGLIGAGVARVHVAILN